MAASIVDDAFQRGLRHLGQVDGRLLCRGRRRGLGRWRRIPGRRLGGAGLAHDHIAHPVVDIARVCFAYRTHDLRLALERRQVMARVLISRIVPRVMERDAGHWSSVVRVKFFDGTT